MKLKKVIKSTIVSVAAMSVFAVPVLAANHSYSFDLYTDYDDNRYSYTAGNPKDDDEQAAYMHTYSGNIMNGDEFYMTVYGMNHISQFTEERKVTSSNATYVEPYNQGNYAGAGEELCIKGETFAYNVYVEGYWFS